MTDAMVAREQLRSVVERIERLEEEKQAIADDIRDVYAEAKANGFDVKVLKAVVKLRKIDLAERQEVDAVTDLYLQALGMLPDFENPDPAPTGVPSVPSVPAAPPAPVIQPQVPIVQTPAVSMPPAAPSAPLAPMPPGFGNNQ